MHPSILLLFVAACSAPAVAPSAPVEPEPGSEPEPEVENPWEEAPPMTDSGTTSTGSADSGTVIDTGLSCQDLAEMVRILFTQQCAACHSTPTAQYAGFGQVLNAVYLVDDGWVIPGHPEKSVVLSVIADGSMPVAGPMAPADQQTVEDWITCGAVPWAPPP